MSTHDQDELQTSAISVGAPYNNEYVGAQMATATAA